MIYPAHIRTAEDGTTEVQTVAEHCRNTAKIAADCLKCVHLESAAYLAGLVHDMGKYTTQFKEYLQDAAAGRAVRSGSVIHTHAAVRFLLEHFHSPKNFVSFQDMTAELLAYAAGAHHGLYDCIDQKHRSGFSHRMEWDDRLYGQALSRFLEQCADEKELDELFEQADKQMEPIYGWINTQTNGNNEEIFFQLGMLARLLLSAVIEGDRQDTAQYLNGLALPYTEESQNAVWNRLLVRVEQKLAVFPSNTPIQKARQQISYQCRTAAEKPAGIYRLNVPTGGGKTLSSLRYALAHAVRYKKSRIIFTSPLLSILEQNAQVMREFIEEDGLILEHHSNVIREEATTEELNPRELITENWQAPIIITTLVQLLNTLFSGKTTCVRRFQALCNCVLVIDEVQTVPTKMLTLFNLAVNFLVYVCGATVVLCSATQPCLEKVEHPIYGELEDLVPYDAKLWAPFERTYPVDEGTRRLEKIPDFIEARLKQTNSLLVICNTKQQARFLYQYFKESEFFCFHLSAAMCTEHRRNTLSRVERALADCKKSGRKVLCISTQLIEAGVDISFECVVRLAAGMDDVVQAAGRCNRNGESDLPVPVYLLNCTDEALGKLQEIQCAKTATLQLLSEFRSRPEQFNENLFSTQAITCYYRNLYNNMPCGAQDYTLKSGGSLFDLLSVNEQYAHDQPNLEWFGLHQAFALAGQKFQVFDQETTDILVPYGSGNDLILEFGSYKMQYQPNLQKKLLEKAKPFMVSVYQFQLEQLEKQGGLISLLDGAILALAPPFYDSETGLTSESDNLNYLEV